MAKLREELDRVMGSRETPTHTDVEKMEYVGWVFQETLRLLSPVAAIARRVTETTDLGNVVLPVDAEVMFPVDAMHHDATYWPDPSAFLPERWAVPVEPCSWLPFSAGARRCLGQHYARLFFSVVLTMMVRAFYFKPAPGYSHSLTFTGFGSSPCDLNDKTISVKMVVTKR